MEFVWRGFKKSNLVHLLCLLVVLGVNYVILHYLLCTYGRINANKLNSVIITFTSFFLISLVLIEMSILSDMASDSHLGGDLLIIIFIIPFLGLFFLISHWLHDDIILLHAMNLTPITLIFALVTFTLISVFFDGESWSGNVKDYKLSKTGKHAKFFVQLYLIILSTTFTIWHYINITGDDYAVAFLVTFAITGFFMINFMLFVHIIFHWSKYNNIISPEMSI